VTEPLANPFAASGRLSPRAFLLAALGVYLAGAAAHMLTTPAVLARAGLWPFVLAQAVLTWLWFDVHARRLRDAGHGTGPAVGIAVLYLLSVAVLLIVAGAFFHASAPGGDPAAQGSVTLLLLLTIFAVLHAPDYGVIWIVMAVLTAVALVPPAIALGFSVWAATRPRLAAQAA
jgi:uncharacterized membrane protein YhaH (DUF805 family)